MGDRFGDSRDGTQKAVTSGGNSWGFSSIALTGDLTNWTSTGTVVIYQGGQDDEEDNFAKYGVFSYGNINGNTLENITWRFNPPHGSFNESQTIPP